MKTKKHLTPMNKRYDQPKRRASLLLSVILVIAYVLPISSNAIIGLTPANQYAQIENIINMYSQDDIVYSVDSAIPVKSVSDDGDKYTLYLFNPYGFAIF